MSLLINFLDKNRVQNKLLSNLNENLILNKTTLSLLKLFNLIGVLLKINKTFFWDRIKIINGLNSILVINQKKQEVIKIIDLKFEPSSCNNEMKARRIYSAITVNPIFVVYKNSVGILKYPYIKITDAANWVNWYEFLNKIYDKILTKDSLSRVKNMTILEFNSLLAEKLENIDNLSFKPFQKLTNAFLSQITLYRNNLNLRDCSQKVTLIERFSHGDLTPNNLLISGDKYYLIDWINGGDHNFLLDLICPYIYFPQNQFWKLFVNSKHDQLDLGPSKISNLNYQKFKNFFFYSSGQNLSKLNLNINLIFCLIELFEKNYLRHSVGYNCKEGRKILQMIYQIIHFVNKI